MKTLVKAHNHCVNKHVESERKQGKVWLKREKQAIVALIFPAQRSSCSVLQAYINVH